MDEQLKKNISHVRKYLQTSSHATVSIGIFFHGEEHYFDSSHPYNYYLGSISKTFTALLMLKTSLEQHVDLNTPINRFFIELKEGNYPTIYQCLTHTSGYYQITPAYIVLPSLLVWGYARRNMYVRSTRKTIINFLNRHRHFKVKNHSYHYSDLNLAIVGMILEEIYHRPFSSLIQDFINKDLKLSNTYLMPKPVNLPDSIWHHIKVKDWVWHPANPFLASGGMSSTAKDMIHYIRHLMTSNDPYVLSSYEHCPESINRHNKIVTTKAFHSYQNSNQMWHLGGVGTHHSSIIFNRKRQIAVVVLSNVSGRREGANASYICNSLYYGLKRHKIKNLDFLKEALYTKKK